MQNSGTHLWGMEHRQHHRGGEVPQLQQRRGGQRDGDGDQVDQQPQGSARPTQPVEGQVGQHSIDRA